MFLFFLLAISLLSLSVSTIIIRAQASFGSPSDGTGRSEKEGNNGKDPKQKDNTDKQMGICVVGAGGPCNGDSNFDGRDDRTGNCILSNGCSGNGSTGSTSRHESATSASTSVLGENNNSRNQNLNSISNNSSSIANSNPNSTSHTLIDGLILKN